MAHLSSPTPRVGLRVFLAILTLLLAATACAASPTVTSAPTAADSAAVDEAAKQFEATPAYLARVQQRTAQATSMRFEVFTSIETSVVDVGSRTAPMSTGELASGRSRVVTDLAPMFGPMAALGGFDNNAMTMTMVTDEESLYLNAPFFAEMMAASGEAGGSEFGWLDQLATGWGRIDLDEVRGTGILNEIGVIGGSDGEEILALLTSVGSVLHGGRDEIRGTEVNVVFADVSIADILESSGESLDGLGLGSGERAALQDLNANVTVLIDDDGMVRRVEYLMDLGQLMDGDPMAQGLDMVMWQRVDFFDFDAEIDVAVPVGAVDITDDFAALLDELN